MTITRRDFLKIAGIGAGGVVLKPPLMRSLAYNEEEWIPGVEKWISSVCLQCPGGCGIMARVIEGRVVKIEGNPLYPSNQGKICPKGQAGLQVLYDPDRIKRPMKRVGYRGSGKWQAISWDEAIRTVVGKLREIRSKEEAHKLVILGGRYRGHMEALFQRFLDAFGSPNHIGHTSISSDASIKAHYFTQGIHDFLGYDLENTNYLVSFGGNFLEAMRLTTPHLRAYGHMRRGRAGKRAKIVQIDTRFSVTAAKADEWIPINPGTDGALALGIAHIIVKEGLFHKDFIENHTFGFEDWHDEAGQNHLGFKTLVLRDYSPDRISKITGIPMDTIRRLAMEFAHTRPAIAIGERGSGMQTNGIYNRMAIHCLNALVGSIDVPGGILTQRQAPFKPWPVVIRDNVAEKGLSMPRIDHAGTSKFPFASNVSQALPEFILNEDPYKIEVIFIYYTNPLYSRPDLKMFYGALVKVPFVVSFSPFFDDTTEYADLILPDCTYLERWQDDITDPCFGYPIVGMRQPVIKPLYDTMNTGDVIIRIAKELGGNVGDSFPWADFKEAIQERLRGFHEAQRGSIVAGSFEEFWKELLEKGGWWDQSYSFKQWDSIYNTPSKKFEFFSQIMRDGLEKIAKEEAKKKGTNGNEEMEKLLKGLKITARGDEVYMPHYEPVRFVGNKKEYPFYLNTYKLITNAEGRGANQPWLQEILGLMVNEKWDNWLEINPNKAKELGISDGDWVWLESPVGKLRIRAKLFAGALPNVINIPTGQGHKAYGRWAKERGTNPNWIIANEFEYLGGLAALYSTRVKVYKA